MTPQQAELHARLQALPLGSGARSGLEGALVAAGLLLAVTAVAAAASARLRARATDLRDAPPLPELDPYEVAYLSGGAERAADAVIVGLVDRGAATYYPSVGMFSNPLPEAEPADAAPYRRPAPSPRGPHPFELAVHRALSQDRATPLREVRAQALRLAPALAERLGDAGLVVREGAAWRAAIRRGASLRVALLVFLSLCARAPMLFIVLSVAALCVFLLVRRLHRTRAGDAVLASLEGRHGSLCVRCPEPGCAEVALGVALFGKVVLLGGSLSQVVVDLAEAARPLPCRIVVGGGGGGGGGDGGGGGGDGGGGGGGGGDGGGGDGGG